MIDQIREAIARMIAQGAEPAAIVMSPSELKQFILELDPYLRVQTSDGGSGYAFEGLPIYRSWHMSGPSVLSREVFRGLGRSGTHRVDLAACSLVGEAATVAMAPEIEPFLF